MCIIPLRASSHATCGVFDAYGSRVIINGGAISYQSPLTGRYVHKKDAEEHNV